MLIQEENDIEQLQERERAVRQLESDILDVNTIFKVCKVFTYSPITICSGLVVVGSFEPPGISIFFMDI